IYYPKFMAKESLYHANLREYYRPKTRVVKPPEDFASLEEFLDNGVSYSPAKPPYCVKLENTFAKLALSKNGFWGKNIAGQPNTRLQQVGVFIGDQFISNATSLQKSDSV